MVRRLSRRSESDRETLPKVWNRSETIREVWNWSGVPPGGRELVGRPSQKSGTSRDIHLEVQN